MMQMYSQDGKGEVALPKKKFCPHQKIKRFYNCINTFWYYLTLLNNYFSPQYISQESERYFTLPALPFRTSSGTASLL